MNREHLNMDRAEIITELFETMDVAKRSMHGHMQAVVAGHSISRSQLELLFTIHHTQPTTAKDLAQKLNLTPGAISQAMEELADQLLIVKEEDPADRRRQVVRVSGEGRQIIKEMDQRRHDVLDKVIENMSDEELLTWLKIQKRIIDVFQMIHASHQHTGGK